MSSDVRAARAHLKTTSKNVTKVECSCYINYVTCHKLVYDVAAIVTTVCYTRRIESRNMQLR